MEVADRIVVMNEGRIEQIGSPAEIYDQPATPFVMSFVGAVNVLAPGALPLADRHKGGGTGPGEAEQIFVRPHDVQVFATPQPGSVPARLRRLTHMGRDIQAELLLDTDELVLAQFSRDQIDYTRLQPGAELHLLTREARTFVPDYSI